MNHLRLDHRLGNTQDDYICPLCLKNVSPGQNPFLHIAAHLEEISLAALLRSIGIEGIGVYRRSLESMARIRDSIATEGNSLDNDDPDPKRTNVSESIPRSPETKEV